MKLLVDACAGRRLANALLETGHDVVYVGDWPVDPGDLDILSFAIQQGRIIITRDKDFGRLAVKEGHPHCGIIRLVRLKPSTEARICQDLFNRHHAQFEKGVLITVKQDKIRIRLP